MIKLPVFILLWIAFLVIKIPTIIVGAFVVPLLWPYRNTLYDDLPWWTRPWSNPEDWMGGPQGFQNSLPAWWVKREGSDFKAFWRYHAIRNPANGLRSFEYLDLDIDKDKVEYVTNGYLKFYEPWYMRDYNPEVKTYWYVCWQGYRAGLKFVHHWNEDKHVVIKFGWRIEPRDSIAGPDPKGTRAKGAGFATKALFYRDG